jgi:hypothetical protein
LAAVGIDDILSIDWQLLIRVNGNKHNTCKQTRQLASDETTATWCQLWHHLQP